MIAESDIALARTRFDLIAADVPLKRVGRELAGLCPFHGEKTPSFYVVPDKGMFHCLEGETIVPTGDKGRQPIGALAGRHHQLLMPDGSFRWGPIYSYGRQLLWAVELHRNGVERTVYATSGHRWFKRASPGLPRDSIIRGLAYRQDRQAVLTEALRKGDRLIATKLAKRFSWALDGRAVQHGIVFGNGSMQRGIYGHVNLHGEKRSLAAWFLPIVPQEKFRDGDKPYLRIYGGRQFEGFKTLPIIDDASDSYLLGFLAGLLATDGCVDDRGAVILNSADRAVLLWAREAALRCGLETGAVGEQFRKGYLAEPGPVYRLEFRRSTLAPAMFLREPHRSRFLAGDVAFERKRWVVERAYETSRTAEVFCAEIPGPHAFGLDDDLLTGNCFGCGAHGDAIAYVMRRRHLDFLEAVAEINGTAHRAPQSLTKKLTRSEERPDDVAAARAIWAEASAEHRSRVELYFQSRFLPVRRGIPPTIREHPGLYCSERRREIPALVAAFKDSAGYVSAVQRIWLESSYTLGAAQQPDGDPHGSRVEGTSKKTRGEMRDGCVRLAPPGPYLGLAEGIETGVAASDLFKMPVWATCGLSRLGFPGHWHLTRPGERPLLWVPPDRPPAGSGAHWVEARPPSIWIPPGTKRVMIFGDNGDVGHWVAEFAADWWRRHDQDAVAVFPPADYSDYADQLRAKALKTRGEVW